MATITIGLPNEAEESVARERTYQEVYAALDDLRAQLLARRRELGLSRETLGARMGVAGSHVYRLESGAAKNYTVTTLFLWCRALGVDLVDVRG